MMISFHSWVSSINLPLEIVYFFVSKDVSSNAKLKSRQSARLAFALTEKIPQEETHFLKELRSALDYLSTISLLLM